MPNWLKVAIGLALTVSLIAVAASAPIPISSVRSCRRMARPITTAPTRLSRSPASPRARSSLRSIRSTPNTIITQGPISAAFERRALIFDGLPPLKVEKLYVITQDDKLRDGEMVLFIGLKADCVSIVFGFPARVYDDIIGKAQG